MIVTVTLNPSIDVSYPLDTLKIDTVNRIENVSKTAGGKGLNVTRVLKDLQADVTATGVLGGHFGQYIKQQLDDNSIKNNFTIISEETRYCIAILHDGKQTEILEAGPHITADEIEQFKTTFSQLLANNNVITISGSMVKGFPTETYAELIKLANEKNCKVLLDTSGKNLKTSLMSQNKPYLIKPNTEELEGLLNITIDETNIQEIVDSLSNSLFNDIEIVIVSLGANGALIKYQDNFYHTTVPKITAVNPVGSGDATIAGLAYAIANNESITDIIKSGMTCGVLNTLNPQTGKIDTTQFEEIYKQINVTQI